jgi:hypothetical protein
MNSARVCTVAEGNNKATLMRCNMPDRLIFVMRPQLNEEFA